MADLQAELQRFLTARFGADVRDAFVSCIQKIHAENLDVAALEESMRTAAEEVASAKAEMSEELQETEDALNTAFSDAVRTITAQAQTATSTATAASQTADDAKVIARAAESNASTALATAANARDEASNAAADAELAMLSAQQVQTAYKTVELLIAGKVDGAFVENGYLYLTSNNEVVAGPLGPFSGSGGSGGSSGNNAVLSVANASGWLSKSIAYGGTCPVTITWSSMEDGLSTGNGVMKLTVNGVVKAMFDIGQGTVTKDISSYLSTGVNAVRITISDVYENSRTINFSINAVDISLSSTFDASVPFTGTITFTYTPVGNVQKEIHILLDGEEIETVSTSSSGRQMSFTIAAQAHGGHTLEAYFTTTIDGTTVESNHLYYEFISLESLNTTPIIVSSFKADTVAQYTTLAIPYIVYDPANLTTAVTLSVNGNVVSQQTVDRTQQIWSYRVDDTGEVALEITCGDTSKTIGFTVTPSDVSIEAETDSLMLYLSSYGRSNNEANPGTWEYGDIAATFSGFNYATDGWMLDDEQFTSYEAQIDYYTNYIKKRDDWEFVKVYTDEGISGTNTKRRDGFNEMVADALAGKIDLIVTKSVSRFARNTVDSLTTVRKLKDKGVEVYFEKENIYTFDGKGELLITIMSSLAQEESRSISENVTWGQRKRFADGKVTMPFKHFLGYDRGENGQPMINEEEAKVVRLIYHLFLQGKTAAGIGKHLEELGIPTPSGKKNWRQTTVMSILQNEKYKGDALLQKKFTVDFLTKKQKVNEGEVPQYYVENSHPAIVSAADFDAVQDEIARRRSLGSSYSGSSLFASKLVCGDCGGLYGQKVWHSTNAYRRVVWRCNGKFKGEAKCQTPTLDTETIQRMFLTAYTQLVASREQLLRDCEMMRDLVNNYDALDAEADSLNEELTVVAGLVSQCIKENATTEQSQEEYTKKYNRLVRRYEKAAARLQAVTEERERKMQRDRELRVFISGIENQPLVLETWDEGLWISLLDTATVHSDNSITFRFKNGTEIAIPA